MHWCHLLPKTKIKRCTLRWIDCFQIFRWPWRWGWRITPQDRHRQWDRRKERFVVVYWPGLKPSACDITLRFEARQKRKESLLTQWQLEGSNDGKQWENIETIHDKNDPQFVAPPLFCTGKWSVKGEIGPFRYFRIFQTGVNSSGKYGIYLSGIEFYGVLLNMCELGAMEALSYKVFIKQPK